MTLPRINPSLVLTPALDTSKHHTLFLRVRRKMLFKIAQEQRRLSFPSEVLLEQEKGVEQGFTPVDTLHIYK
ncbi:hypothetical protein KSC_020050 [Ktedonobacter sp. SOSP1-52]|nr:hypothetical protein KSC_020050 [Ktedonobacter sp. SOSP1-52]